MSEENHAVLVERLVDAAKHRRVDVLRKIDPANFGAECFACRDDLETFDCVHEDLRLTRE